MTGQSWHWDVLKCSCKYHCHEKSLILHWVWPLFLQPRTRMSFPKMTTRGQQRPADGTHSLLMAWLKGSLAFYSEMQWRARFSLSPHDITAQCLHRFHSTNLWHILVISPFRRPTTWFSFGTENYSRCLMQSSREWKFLSIKKNSETRTKWPWERAQSLSTMEESGLHSQAGSVFPGHQREMCSLT